jgi:hypothetical protein
VQKLRFTLAPPVTDREADLLAHDASAIATLADYHPANICEARQARWDGA